MPINSFDQYPLTWKPDKKDLKPPYYRSLAAHLEQQITSGLLKPGTQLPPQREIADYLDLNYTTITRVYALCKKKGLIYGVTGKGTFVAPHAAEEDRTTGQDLAGMCIELGAVNGFSEYSQPVEQAVHAVMEKGYARHLFDYSFPAGHPHQLAAGARWLEQLGVHTDGDHLAISAGAQNGLAVALLSLFSPGDRIAVDPYIYSNFIQLAKLLHLVLVPIQGDAGGMLPEELDRQCRDGRIQGIYLIPTCSNPTTITLSLARRQALAEVIRQNHLILLEDDISTWLYASAGLGLPSLFDLLQGQSIYICGMTKSLCPGLRIAYVAFADRFRAPLLHGLTNVNLKTSSFDAEVITELLLSGKAYQIAAQKRQWAQRNARLYSRYFPADPAPSYYKWLPVRLPQSPRQVEQELQALGVRVYHSARFAAAPSGGPEYLRVSLCSAGSTRRLVQGFRILQHYLQEHTQA